MPSFDTICKPNLVELKNACEQANKEISTRFDFKGSDARVDHTDELLTMFADDDFKLSQVQEVMLNKLAKRSVDVRYLDYQDKQRTGGDKVKQEIKIKSGVPSDDAKKIVAIIKNSKMKVQGSIQGDTVRVTGAKRDDLQAAMAMLKTEVKDLPIAFDNFRD